MRSVSFWTMIVDLLISVLSNIVGYFNAFTFGLISFDFASGSNYLMANYPFFATIGKLMTGIAIVLMLIITVWQLVKSFISVYSDVEKPQKIILRACLCLVGIYLIRPFTSSVVFAPLTAIWDMLKNTSDGMTVTFNTFFESMDNVRVSGLASIAESLTLPYTIISKLGTGIITIILEISIVISFVKLVLQVVERWVQILVLYITSPMAVAVAVTEGSKNIFGSWLRTFGSAVILIILNSSFLILFQSALANFAQHTSNGYGSMAIPAEWVWCLLCLAVLRVGNRMESIMSSMGINVAQSGAGLLGDLMAGAGAMFMGARIARGGIGMAKNGKIGDMIRTSKADHAAAQGRQYSTIVNNTGVEKAMPGLVASGAVQPNMSRVNDAMLREDRKATQWRMSSPETGEIQYTMYNDAKDAYAENPDGTIRKVETAEGDKYVHAVAMDVANIQNTEQLRSEIGQPALEACIPGYAKENVASVTTNANGVTSVYMKDDSVHELHAAATTYNDGKSYAVVSAANGQTYLQRDIGYNIDKYRPTPNMTSAMHAQNIKDLRQQTKLDVVGYEITHNGRNANIQLDLADGKKAHINSYNDYSGINLPKHYGMTQNKGGVICSGPTYKIQTPEGRNGYVPRHTAITNTASKEYYQSQALKGRETIAQSYAAGQKLYMPKAAKQKETV